MKYRHFRIWFSNGNYLPQSVNVSAFGIGEAKTLAQAERIKAGMDYTVCNAEEIRK